MEFNLQDAASFAEKLDALVANPDLVLQLEDDVLRRRLREAGRKLSRAMESAGDTTHRLNNTTLELALARVGVEKGIFSIFASHAVAMTNAELSKKTQADPVLMKRLLRYYQSQEMISQLGDDSYRANYITKAPTTLIGESGTGYFFEMIHPSFVAIPQFLRENGYKNPSDPNHAPWHLGHKTEMNPFPWLKAHPEYMKFFLPWMATMREGQPSFLDGMDFRKEILSSLQNTDNTIPVFVDVGGAMGHQCIALQHKYPDFKGRIILQDQPFIIDQVKTSPLPGFQGIEAMAYDFFTPQPIKGASAYYLSCILHDWPDHKCEEILKNLKGAMKTGSSYLLVDEIVFPERGAAWRATNLDISMMTCLAAWERTAAQWTTLLEKAGFKIQNIWEYAPESHNCLVIAVPQ
ncbi:S-adenosyl-L-methionine-dependent methyltransferase [Cryphonectria parasitica EP155]|uniref:S-adenosyl-L-methionine-dependent methyltransferase n=1 Tax=Cryphonectria parasitica (strain ATCC 38755 / EP155) TaxID=660469 RepID=A0A9P4XUJ2_CRYP1|nr:S-adenosyl-L-methionine-dependent methyltransferase [Cryphonectria parasitica EP155]KAF3761234.1 S-adenosyl-L-methionine-dependent methyltransferase [Cryphonectria parasitica EP155]